MFVDGHEIKSKSYNIKMTPKQFELFNTMANERGLKKSQLIMMLLEKEFNKPSLIKQNDSIIMQQSILDGVDSERGGY